MSLSAGLNSLSNETLADSLQASSAALLFSICTTTSCRSTTRGKELPSRQAAREHAMGEGLSSKHRIEISDESGKFLGTVRFHVVEIDAS
jgi:hypothetical protein